MHTEENKHRTLQKNDIAAAITKTDICDFLVDIIPRDEIEEDGVGLPRTELAPMGTATDAYPYYYMPHQQVLGPGMVYGAQQGHPVSYLWQEPQEQQEQTPEEQRALHESV
jgi:nuclear transcription factor Y gamma